MSHEEKGTWVALVVSLVTFAAYLAVVLTRLRGSTPAEVAYAAPMLWTIGTAIVLTIVVRLAVQLVRPSETHRADERDRQIGRAGEFTGGLVLAVAMLAPLALTLAQVSYFWIANAIFAAFYLQSWVSSSRKLVAYRRGL